MKKATGPLKEKIYKQLRNEIVFGQLGPGEHVKEACLTEKFNCSRGPVREAFNQLEKEGFLVLLPNRGAVVSKISPEEVADYYALLELLEGQAVEWAAARINQAGIEKAERVNEALKQISHEDRSSIEAWVALNLDFHRIFRESCGNSRMDLIVEEIRMRITRYRYTSLLVTASDEYLADHEKIIEAIRRRNAKQAGDAMRTHIRRAKEILNNFFNKFPII